MQGRLCEGRKEWTELKTLISRNLYVHLQLTYKRVANFDCLNWSTV